MPELTPKQIEDLEADRAARERMERLGVIHPVDRRYCVSTALKPIGSLVRAVRDSFDGFNSPKKRALKMKQKRMHLDG